MASPIKHWTETVEYSRLDAAKLLCQYNEYVQLALKDKGSFYLWYHSQTKSDLELMHHDQKTRKVKQGSKIAGKIIGNVASIMFLGVGGYSKSPVKDIAITAIMDEEIWSLFYNNNITYSVLRKMNDAKFYELFVTNEFLYNKNSYIDRLLTNDYKVASSNYENEYNDIKQIEEMRRLEEEKRRQEREKENLYNDCFNKYNNLQIENDNDVTFAKQLIDNLKSIFPYKSSQSLIGGIDNKINQYYERKREEERIRKINDIYVNAIALVNIEIDKNNKGKFISVVNELKSIDYKDSEDVYLKLKKKLDDYLEKERIAAIALRRKIIKYASIVSILLILLVSFIILLVNVKLENDKSLNRYNGAIQDIESENYLEAEQKLNSFYYKDSKIIYELLQARKEFSKGDYEKGIDIAYKSGCTTNISYDGYESDAEIIKLNSYVENGEDKKGQIFESWSIKEYKIDYKQHIIDLTLMAQYSVISYAIEYELDGGINNSSNPTYYTVNMDSIKLEEPTKEGYTFQGWEYNGEIINEVNTQDACDIKLKAIWIAVSNTTYRVEHYLQNLDNDNYSCTPYETDYLTGTTDTFTNASVKKYEGFTSPEITQVNIDGDGSTIIKLYYTRNIYILSININNDKAGSVTDISGIYKYGQEIITTAKTNVGYTFDGWYDGNNQVSNQNTFTFNMPAKNLVYKAKWTANPNTSYKVEHYLQNLDDDNYPTEPYETDNLTGTTNTLTNSSAKIYEGFTSPEITQVSINADGSTVIKLYYERNSYELTLNNSIENAGILIGAGNYKYGKKITIRAITKSGYTFDGWYNGKNIISEDVSFDYTVKTLNVIEARYIINKYSITVYNHTAGAVISDVVDEKFEYNSSLTLTAKNIPVGYTIKWSRSDNVISSGNNYTFNVPATNLKIYATITGPYTRNENKLYFGRYPQTLITNNSVINELNNMAGELPSDNNLYNWINYNYYIGGNIMSFMYYQDIDYDNDGDYDYRGVYFTQYRQNNYNDSTSTYDSYQKNEGYTIDKVHWFSYNPIEWIVLRELDGKALIISNLIMDSQEYYPSLSKEMFDHNGGTGYANNYELSNIRKWLNDTFYNIAFSNLEKELIENTIVDNTINSVVVMSNNKNIDQYICNNTNDKVFLLSYLEALLVDRNSIRKTKGTDYAYSQGLYKYGDGSPWFLRSPNVETVYGVVCDGFFGNRIVYENSGIRPACWINL